MTSRFASLTEQDIEDEDSETQRTKVPKELFADHMKEKKLREPEEKKELAQTLTIFMSPRSKKERISSMYNKTIIRIRSMYNKTIISL